MALFLIERTYAEQLNLATDAAEAIDATEAYNAEHDLTWLFSFLSADKRKSYCLYEAPDAQSLIEHAEALGLPADAIVEVTEMNPKLWGSGKSVTGHPAG